MDDDCDWFCDGCGACMNDQPGFTTLTGKWICTQCGAINDVSENNIFDLLKMLADGIEEFETKPLGYEDDN